MRQGFFRFYEGPCLDYPADLMSTVNSYSLCDPTTDSSSYGTWDCWETLRVFCFPLVGSFNRATSEAFTLRNIEGTPIGLWVGV